MCACVEVASRYLMWNGLKIEFVDFFFFSYWKKCFERVRIMLVGSVCFDRHVVDAR